MQTSLTIIIPAFNEEANIRGAIEAIEGIVQEYIADYELLVFDDGSRDGTYPIVVGLSLHHPRIKLIANMQNRGLAYIAREGIRLASKSHLTWFPGDNSISRDSMGPILEAIGQADIIVAYMSNVHQRDLLRRWLSRTFTFLMNTLFALKIRYYNGPTVYPTSLARSVQLSSNGYDFFAELLIRCLKKGATYQQVPFFHKTENEQNTKAFSWRNIKSVFRTTLVLLRDIYLASLRKKLSNGSKELILNDGSTPAK